MRLPTVLISTAFMLAGMSAAFTVERENMLVARFADSDFLPEVEARAYDEPELYTRGCIPSKINPSRSPTEYSLESIRQSVYSGSTVAPSSSHPPLPRTGGSVYSGATLASSHASRDRRSLYEPSEIRRRRDQRWTRNGCGSR